MKDGCISCKTWLSSNGIGRWNRKQRTNIIEFGQLSNLSEKRNLFHIIPLSPQEATKHSVIEFSYAFPTIGDKGRLLTKRLHPIETIEAKNLLLDGFFPLHKTDHREEIISGNRRISHASDFDVGNNRICCWVWCRNPDNYFALDFLFENIFEFF